jgi:hypothetical protein
MRIDDYKRLRFVRNNPKWSDDLKKYLDGELIPHLLTRTELGFLGIFSLEIDAIIRKDRGIK